MKEVAIVTGPKIPRIVLRLLMESRISVVPTRSDFTREMARAFSSAVSQRAVSGRSVRVKNPMTARPQVIMPSIAKIICHLRRLPKLFSERIPEARSPPNAPASGAMTMYSERRKASSLLRYQRDI